MEFAYKCLVVDDEVPAHLVIKSHLSHFDEFEYVDSAYNGKEAIQFMTENEYDCVFLDIEMPLINGIEVLQTMKNRPATIITTAYDNFAFEAYQQDAIDYLLKPISLSRFMKSMEKVKKYLGVKSNTKSDKMFILKIDGIAKEISYDDIIYFQSTGNYIKVFLKDYNKAIIIYDSLKNLLNNLPSNSFVQTHKSYVINSNLVTGLMKDKLILSNAINVPIGRKYELLLNKFLSI
jgi:two-component system, LytTR family, response regulator